MQVSAKVAAAIAVALACASTQASAGGPPEVSPTELAQLQSQRYSVPSDVAFHAAVAALQDLGFEDIDASKDAGVINAITDSKAKTIFNVFWGFGKKKWTQKATLSVEDYGGGSQVRLTLHIQETKARGKSQNSFSDGELVRYAQPYQDFFAALNAEVARRGGAAGTAAATAAVDSGGNIDVGDGVKLIPAKTLSGYCIKAAPGYVGTGAANMPAVTTARPLCA
jgi:hypothetical protein